MSWLKIDDQFPDHPKVVKAGPLACWLHVCGMAYCARYLTDGFIPGGQVRKLADVDDSAGLAKKLLSADLWEKVNGGFQVHNYLRYNPSRKDVIERRAAAAKRQAEWRNKERAYDGRYQSNAVSHEAVTPLPTPIPSPSPSPSPSPNPVPEEEIAAATPPPKPPKRPVKRKRKTDPRTNHPAIQAVREVTNRYPPKPIWDDIIKVLGDEPRIEEMRLCFKEWVKPGFKPTNFAWLFDWYVSGIPAKGASRQSHIQQQTAEAIRQFAEDGEHG